MKKAILIGNGFTSNLIFEFQNENMMKKFNQQSNNLFDRINDKFESFRDQSLYDSDIYKIIEALYPSKNLYPSKKLFPSDDRILFIDSIKQNLLESIKNNGFKKPNIILNKYFIENGLIYMVNKKKIRDIESMLKVVHMFIETGEFSKTDYENIKTIADNIYYNGGYHGFESINNTNINKGKLISEITKFDEVYTTNFDTVLDDILEAKNKYPLHLHGGFNEAILIWGISADDKFEQLNVSLSYSDIYFSSLGDYFQELQESSCEEIYILGFSGENDSHINSRIKNNKNIKNIIYYTHPNKINDKEEKIKLRILFKGSHQNLIIKSWDEFWNKVK